MHSNSIFDLHIRIRIHRHHRWRCRVSNARIYSSFWVEITGALSTSATRRDANPPHTTRCRTSSNDVEHVYTVLNTHTHTHARPRIHSRPYACASFNGIWCDTPQRHAGFCQPRNGWRIIILSLDNVQPGLVGTHTCSMAGGVHAKVYQKSATD